MRRNFTKEVSLALAMAGLAGAGQVASAQTLTPGHTNTVEYKATTKRKVAKQRVAGNDVTGGLDFNHGNPYGMSPKEYGMLYGNGGAKRSNRLRYSHNAKLRRRIKH